MKIIKAPQELPNTFTQLDSPVFFLAGPCTSWRKHVIRALDGSDCTLIDPVREDKDGTWEESMKDKRFVDQTTWEREAMTRADYVVFYFDPATLSGKGCVVTLLELALCAAGHAANILIGAPLSFWKKGHVDFIAKTYGLPLFPDLPRLIGKMTYVVSVTHGDDWLQERKDLWETT